VGGREATHLAGGAQITFWRRQDDVVDCAIYPKINGSRMWRLVHGSWSYDEPLRLIPQPPEPGEELLTRIHGWARSAQLCARRDAGYQLSRSEIREAALGEMVFPLNGWCQMERHAFRCPDCEAPITLWRMPTDNDMVGLFNTDGQPYPAWQVLHGHQSTDHRDGTAAMTTYPELELASPYWAGVLRGIHGYAELEVSGAGLTSQ
jgi:hypothetical protein